MIDMMILVLIWVIMIKTKSFIDRCGLIDRCGPG